MAKLLFNKKIPKHCEYCTNGNKLLFTGEILCSKHGIVPQYECCGSYKYDPLKRIPQGVKLNGCYSKKDFEL